VKGLVDVNDHHDTCLHGETTTDKRPNQNPVRRSVFQKEQRPEATDQGEGHGGEHDQRFGQTAELQERSAIIETATIGRST